MASLKEFRKFVGLTQNELAKKSGINIRQIQKYESGECGIENMTAKTACGLSEALGCTMEELINLDLNVFTSTTKECVQAGEMTISDLIAMDKYEKVRKLSIVGSYGDTFRANFDRIPEGLFEKLAPEELAALVDAFYQCYSDGKSR